MPTYEYLCQKCEREFEVEQRITDDPIKTCPSCRSRKVKRLISRTSFVLKGGGWYSDLYSGPDSKKPKDAGAASETSKPAEGGKPSDAGKEASPAGESSPASSGSEPKAETPGAGKKGAAKGAKGAKAAA